MESRTYRSFVVRAWASRGAVRRASVESVQDGVSVDLQGDAASRLLDSIDEAMASGARDACRDAGHPASGAGSMTREDAGDE